MKKILIPLVLILITVNISRAQSNISGILSLEDDKTIQVINSQSSQNLSLDKIYNQPVNGSWSQLAVLGAGLPSCTTDEFVGTECFVRKSGVEIYYSNQLGEFKLGRLTITNADFVFKIKGHIIKVGDHVSKLMPVHPDAYSKRHKLKSQRWPNTSQVLLHYQYGDASLSFEYNTTTNIITKIEWHQSLV